jgi:glycosyltransferase involved in cell wall biosynthesis
VSRPRLLVISLSDLARDPRVDRQLRALRSSYDIVAAGLGPPSVSDVDYIDLNAPASRPAALANQLAGAARMLARRYESAYWGNRLLGQARERLADVRPDAVIANDVPALPLAFAVADGAPVMLDAHEYAPLWFEDRRLWRTVMQPYMTALTRHHVPRVAAMTTVAPALVDAYRELTGVEATVVTNAPAYHDLLPRPVDGRIRLLHHGIANRSRGLEHTIETMAHLDERFTLDLVLIEHELRYLRRLRRLAAPDTRIRFLDPVPMRDIVRFANAYDVGVFLLPPSNFNYANALPNKLFEFIQARLAVAIGPSPEMARVVREWGCGIVAKDFQPASLAAELQRLDSVALIRHKERSHAAAGILNAEANERLLHQLTERVLAQPTSSAS